MKKPIEILAFGASNSHQSINQRLALHAARVLKMELAPSVVINALDLNNFEMPIYSPEREQEGIPQRAHDFFAHIGVADGLIVSLAEYNGSYTAAFKNIYDWVSRIDMKLFQDKPMLIMSTSLGRRGGESVLNAALDAFPHFGANITSLFKVGPFADHFDTDANCLTTPEPVAELRQAIVAFHSELQST